MPKVPLQRATTNPSTANTDSDESAFNTSDEETDGISCPHCTFLPQYNPYKVGLLGNAINKLSFER